MIVMRKIAGLSELPKVTGGNGENGDEEPRVVGQEVKERLSTDRYLGL